MIVTYITIRENEIVSHEEGLRDMVQETKRMAAEIRCGKCGNSDFKMRVVESDGVKTVIAECKCGREVGYDVVRVHDFEKELEKVPQEKECYFCGKQTAYGSLVEVNASERYLCDDCNREEIIAREEAEEDRTAKEDDAFDERHGLLDEEAGA